MNQDFVFYGVFICFGGAALVLAWLFFMLYRNMNKPAGSK